ncbi:hypothetical protein sscle_15g104500 [Sclerotinia sclerotiorum 1980 UF-70]|uniref:Nephrocystin 3-like N-terminal domain-containing protein n=1 Tax=Sclerotinia sclerotiorum (strain ATCC 18683 / 1980 / Ss-1) TaxID=665079 RepID=A0A1D9QL66_SCLS1|nr:hypothetical protein sscle_15g104500 [Sclerotinia sclerotiorum 1980 UF-70]
MTMAMSARQMSALIEVLANQEQLNRGISAVKAEQESSRLERQISAREATLKKKLDILCTIDVRKWQDSNVRLRQSGTGLWFTESKELQDWASADHSKLWVYGIGLAIFYCDYKDSRTHDPRTILGELARQLIQHENAFIQLEAFCKKHNMTESAQGSATPEDFCQLIVEISKNFISTSIVVDGLDEAGELRADGYKAPRIPKSGTGNNQNLAC